MRTRLRTRALGVAALCALSTASCRRASTEIIVFHAASLTRALGEASSLFEKEHPGVHVRLEPSGSQVAARKVADQGMRADLVAVADAKIIERILMPRHARFNIVFATNEIVLAHKDHSSFATEMSTENWPAILLRPNVRLGRADPDTAPIGYHTLIVWQLAERSGRYGESGRNLASALLSRCERSHVVHDETELLAQLESRALDYAFLYRSTAEDHHMKITTLPPTENLSRPELADHYATEQIDVQMKQGEAKVHVRGSPITYGVTLPERAPHAAQATQFMAFLLGDPGHRILERRGFRAMAPARCDPCLDMPKELETAVVR